jgi:O-antigen/teichoic acid export membrane protein
MRTVLKDTKSIFITQIILVAISLVSSVLVARLLGPHGKGQIFFLLSFPMLIASFAKLGIGQASAYFLGSEKHSIDEVLSGSIFIALLVGIIGIIIGLVLFRSIAKVFVDIKFNMFVMVLFLTPGTIFTSYCTYIFLGLKKIRQRNILGVISPVIYTTFVLVIWLLNRFTLENVIISYVVSSFVPILFILHYFRVHYGYRWHLDFAYIREAIKFGIIPFITLLVMNLNYKVDIYMIKFFQTTEQLGLYSISVSWAERLWWLPQALGLVIFSRIPGMTGKDATELTSKSTRILLNLTVLFALVYAAFSIYFIPIIYGVAFGGSIVPFIFLLPGVIAIVVYKLLHPDFVARNKAKYSLYSFTVALVLNIVLNYILIPRLGIKGASLASTISYSVGAFMLLVIFSKINQIGMRDVLVLKSSDITLLKNSINTKS